MDGPEISLLSPRILKNTLKFELLSLGGGALKKVSAPGASHNKKYLNFPIVLAWKFKGSGQFSLGN